MEAWDWRKKWSLHEARSTLRLFRAASFLLLEQGRVFQPFPNIANLLRIEEFRVKPQNSAEERVGEGSAEWTLAFS